jgi:hypothetical protein
MLGRVGRSPVPAKVGDDRPHFGEVVARRFRDVGAMLLRKLAVGGVAMLALAGCTGGGDDATASATPSSNHNGAVELARCMRANGFPDFPDPVQDDQGRWDFPVETAGDWLPADACRSLVADWKSAFDDHRAAGPESMAQLREYAACMREQGLADFPDPQEGGNFELPQRLRDLADNEDPTFAAAQQLCKQHLPPKPIGKDGGS